MLDGTGFFNDIEEVNDDGLTSESMTKEKKKKILRFFILLIIIK
jgi:hypothetical protein